MSQRNPPISRIAFRANTPDPAAGYCGWCDVGSRKPSLSREGKGRISGTLCRQHKDHLDRHGHPCKPSYTSSEYGPFIALARRWVDAALSGRKSTKGLLIAAAAEADVERSVAAISHHLTQGRDDGRSYPRNAQAKARAIVGRLRAKYCGKTDPGVRLRWPKRLTEQELAARIVAWVIAMELTAALDSSRASDEKFMDMQVGKLLFRRAGGWTRRYWGEPKPGTRLAELREVNYYPISRGAGVATLGRQFRSAVEWLWETNGAALEEHARLAIPEGTIKNWTLERASKGTSKPPRGGRRKKPIASTRQPFGPQDRLRNVFQRA